MAATLGAAPARALQTPPIALTMPPTSVAPSTGEAPTLEVPYKLLHRPQELIQEGTSVLLDINGEKTSFAVVKKSLRVRVGKNLVSLEPLIGLPFGSKFEVRTGPNTADLVPVSAKAETESLGGKGEEGKERADVILSVVTKVIEEKTVDMGVKVKKDNRALVDNNTAQALSKEDVEELRRQGLSGQEIIQALVANSATFSGKTEFSQEKYLKKKQKKYAPQMTVRRPSGRSVCEAYFNKNPEKTCYMRSDSLSLLLTMSNASANHDVLVFESCGGLVTAAVAERLGGHGTVCSTYTGPRPDSVDLARMFNFDEATNNSIVRAPLQSLVSSRAAKGGKEKEDANVRGVVAGGEKATGGVGKENAAAGGGACTLEGEGMEIEEKPSGSERKHIETEDEELDGWRNLGVGLEPKGGEGKEKGNAAPGVSGEGLEERDGSGWRGLGVGDEAEIGPSTRAAKAAERKARRDDKKKTEGGGPKVGRIGGAASGEQLQRWGQQGFTSLVVAAPGYQPLAVAQAMLPLLAPSSSFAFYNTSLQSLAECMHWLQQNRKAVALQLGEPWLREYQVLPARTHPHMQMSATGGYVLSGITLVEEEAKADHEEEKGSKEAGNKRKRGKGPPSRGGKRGRGR